MSQLKIGIVEDELLIAESIVITLQQIGYRTTNPTRNYADALKMIETEAPDLLLVDIILEGEKDGIDLALKINKDYGLPFIFLTANSDHATVNRAKEAKPSAYLVKPFNEQDLFSSIEIAFSNFNNQISKEAPPTYLKETVFIKEGHLFHKVEINDILYMESDNVYLNIYTVKKHYLVRTKLEDFINDFPKGILYRIHRSYAVNIKHLDTINELSVKVGGKEIPVNKNYRDGLLHMIKSVK